MTFDRRIVIDTGVLISAAIRPKSPPALALAKAFLRFAVCMCDETWSELENVLMRDKFDTYLRIYSKRPGNARKLPCRWIPAFAGMT